MSPLTINVKKGQFRLLNDFEVAVFKHLSFSDIEQFSLDREDVNPYDTKHSLMNVCTLTTLMQMTWDRKPQLYVFTYVEGSILTIVRFQIDPTIRYRAEELLRCNGRSESRRKLVQSWIETKGW